MNTLLTQYVRTEEGKTRVESTKAYEEAWENSKYLLAPLKVALKKRLEALEVVRETDFNIQSHYAKLMFQAGRKEELKLLLSLLPKTLDD